MSLEENKTKLLKRIFDYINKNINILAIFLVIIFILLFIFFEGEVINGCISLIQKCIYINIYEPEKIKIKQIDFNKK